MKWLIGWRRWISISNPTWHHGCFSCWRLWYFYFNNIAKWHLIFYVSNQCSIKYLYLYLITRFFLSLSGQVFKWSHNRSIVCCSGGCVRPASGGLFTSSPLFSTATARCHCTRDQGNNNRQEGKLQRELPAILQENSLQYSLQYCRENFARPICTTWLSLVMYSGYQINLLLLTTWTLLVAWDMVQNLMNGPFH